MVGGLKMMEFVTGYKIKFCFSSPLPPLKYKFMNEFRKVFVVKYFCPIVEHDHGVVLFTQVIDGLGQWLSHISGHELKHHGLMAGAKNQAEPDEKHQQDSTEVLFWQFCLSNSEKDSNCVVCWHVDSIAINSHTNPLRRSVDDENYEECQSKSYPQEHPSCEVERHQQLFVVCVEIIWCHDIEKLCRSVRQRMIKSNRIFM
jgi:hypothetical protein